MNHIHIKSLGFAAGITAALLYLSCALVMNYTNAEISRSFFNGIDIGSILRMNITFQETVAGLIQTFVIAWLTGASVAAIYNILISTRRKDEKNF